MAAISTRKKQESAAAPVQKPPSGGEFDYTRSGLQFNEPAAFLRFAAGYPDQGGILAYVYRLKPKIDLGLIGVGVAFIKKTRVVEEMSPDFIGREFGRGHYQLKLNDGNRKKGEREVAQIIYELDDLDKAPVYDPRTLMLGNTANQDEINRLLANGVLVREAATGTPRLRSELDGPITGAPVAVQAAPGLPVDITTALLKMLMDRGVQNPHDAVKDTIEVARLLVPQNAQPQMSVEQIADLVVRRMEERTRATNANGDIFETYTKMDSFMAKFRPAADLLQAAAPGTKAAGAAAWAPHIPGIIAQARSFLGELFSEFKNMRAGSAPAQQNAAAAPGGQTQPMPRQMTFEEKIAEVAQLCFQRMEEGVSGFDVAAYVCNFHQGGADVYQFLEPGGTAGTIGLIAMNPATRYLTSDPDKRAQIEKFLDEFFTYSVEAVPEDPAAAPGNAGAGGAGASPNS